VSRTLEAILTGASAPGRFNQAGQILEERPDETQHLVLQVGSGEWGQHPHPIKNFVVVGFCPNGDEEDKNN